MLSLNYRFEIGDEAFCLEETFNLATCVCLCVCVRFGGFFVSSFCLVNEKAIRKETVFLSFPHSIQNLFFWHDSHLAISWFKGDQCSNRHPEERSDKQTCDLFTIVGCYCSVCVTFYTKHFLFFISKLAVCHNQNCSFFGTRNSDFVNEQLKLLFDSFYFSHL